MRKSSKIISAIKNFCAPKISWSFAPVNKNLAKHRNYLLLIFFTTGLYFIRIFSKIIFFKPDGLYASHQNVWADWALHITITNTFANKPLSEWFLYHPYFSGGKLTYPFLTHAISALLMKMGLHITTAMNWSSIVLILLLLMGMYFLFYQIIKSKKKAVLGIFIFLTSAGPGFINFIKDFLKHPTIDTLTFPPIDYSRIIKYQWLAGNIPTAMLVPQRAFLIGITIATWSILLFTIAFQQKPILKKSKIKQKQLFVVAGLLAGILPIAHMHSFIATIFITGFICMTQIKTKTFKKLLYFVVPAGILSAILYFNFIHGGIQRPNFMRILLGWTSDKNIFSWMYMWWQTWGIMIPVAAYSLKTLYQNNKSKAVAKYFFGFFAIFIVANIIVFQPTEWDNTKLFAWVYFGFSLLAAHLIVELWRSVKKSKMVIAALLLIMLSTTGVLELVRLQRFDKNTHRMSETEDIEFAKYVMENTKTTDIFLTGTAHNHPIQMWGSRSAVLGYMGWIENFGFSMSGRANDVRTIFTNPSRSTHLIKKYDIDYIVVGKLEKKEFSLNQEDFDKLFPVKFQDAQTTIYKVK